MAKSFDGNGAGAASGQAGMGDSGRKVRAPLLYSGGGPPRRSRSVSNPPPVTDLYNQDTMSNSTVRDDDRLNSLLAKLRSSNASALQAMREQGGISLADIKRIVFDSPPWRDAREGHEQLVDAILAAIECDES